MVVEEFVTRAKGVKATPFITLGVPLVIGGGLTILPEPVSTVVGVTLLSLTIKNFLGATPSERDILFGGFLFDFPLFLVGAKGGRKAKQLITEGVTKLRPSFRKIEIKSLGEQIIKDIPTKEGGLIELGLIPPGKGRIAVDVAKLLEETKGKIPFKPKPKIPKLTKTQQDIIDVIKKEDVTITGSLAQKTLLTKSRGFADIDVIAKDIGPVAKSIKQKLGSKVRVERVRITDSPLGEFNIVRVIERKTGRVLVDIDPLAFAEEGLALTSRVQRVSGIKFISPETRLASKILQLERGKKLRKVGIDIDILTAQQLGIQQRLQSPLIRGAFGFTREEQAKFIGKVGPVATSARDLFGRFFRKEVTITEPGLFATPFELGTGRALTRISRLALKEREATPLDILKLNFKFKEGKPQIIVFPKQKIGEEFKPFGFPSSELEVLLKAGKIIQKEKQIAITLIEGKKVPIIEARIGEASKITRDLLLKKKISLKEQQEISRRLAKETGFDVLSILKPTKPILRPSRFIPKVGVSREVTTRRIIIRAISTLPFIGPSARPSGPPSRKPSIPLTTTLLGPISGPPSVPPSRPPSIPPSIPPSVPPSIPPGPPSRPPVGPPSRPPSVPPSRPPKAPPVKPPPILILPAGEEEGRPKPGFNTFIRKGEKRGSKFVKVAENLPKNRAIRFGANNVDNFIEASFLIKSSGRKTTQRDIPRARVNLNKFRGVRKGTILPDKTIVEFKEKRLDRIGERLQISFFRIQALKNRVQRQIQAKPRRRFL